MRLIDADAVIAEQRRKMGVMYGNTAEELKKNLEIDDELSVPIHAMEGYSRAKQFYYGLKGILENAPTVDAVPVVRCRDCKYCRNLPNGLCYLYTEPYDNERGYKGEAVCVEPDDYCSCGERRTDNETD